MNWQEFIKQEEGKEYYKQILSFVYEDEKKHTIYPSKDNIFNAFKLTPLENIKVLICGQDPYHGPNQAHGLAFSVQNGVAIPPSLKNIFKELKSDLGIDMQNNGNLESWAKAGVMLLNTSLTVRAGQANSHSKIGWTEFTDNAIKLINEKTEPVVFVLWGANARSKKSLIINNHHLIIESAHPSPLSAHNGFFGSKPFSRTNEFLIKNDIKQIDWK